MLFIHNPKAKSEMPHFVNWVVKNPEATKKIMKFVFHLVYFDSCKSSSPIMHVNIGK